VSSNWSNSCENNFVIGNSGPEPKQVPMLASLIDFTSSILGDFFHSKKLGNSIVDFMSKSKKQKKKKKKWCKDNWNDVAYSD